MPSVYATIPLETVNATLVTPAHASSIDMPHGSAHSMQLELIDCFHSLHTLVPHLDARSSSPIRRPPAVLSASNPAWASHPIPTRAKLSYTATRNSFIRPGILFNPNPIHSIVQYSHRLACSYAAPPHLPPAPRLPHLYLSPHQRDPHH